MFEVEDRHIRIWGRMNQNKLKKTKLFVSGTGLLAQYVLAGISALGFGNLVIADNARARTSFNFLAVDNMILGSKKNKFINETLKRLNNSVNYTSYFIKPTYSILSRENPDIIIDCSNNSYSKEICFEYSKKTNKLMYSASSSGKFAKFVKPKTLSEAVLVEYHGLKQGVLTSGTIASILLDSVRKEIFVLEGENKLVKGDEVTYFLPKLRNDYGNAIIVGAGALGTFSSLGLASSNMNLEIVDSDIIEVSNLNRQILYYGLVGKYKAESLAKRISKLNKSIDVNYLIKKVSSYNVNEVISEVDIILGCVDNFKTRKILSSAAVNRGKVYVDGRTDQSEGELSSYIPSKNNCLNCRKGFSRFKEIKTSCTATNVTPSVITTNMFVGTQMAVEALSLNLDKNVSLAFSSYSKRLFLRKKDISGDYCGC